MCIRDRHRGAELVIPDVLVRLRVAELDVGVVVDVVAAPHLPGVVDVELRRAKGDLRAGEREPARVLVEPDRSGGAGKRRPSRVEADMAVSYTHLRAHETPE